MNSFGLIDEKDAAAYLGLSVKTLQAWRFTHRPPKYLRLGRSIRYRLSDLDAFLNANLIDPERR
ncbi:helix-turn-helix domain-containing protein [Desulfolutivibrio sp.]|uniref:helix-turn-helix domain-containing protein n=1 Tax=Desulfolutivibrio sp. TaxID=2773296 RepID=UPI002F9678BF